MMKPLRALVTGLVVIAWQHDGSLAATTGEAPHGLTQSVGSVEIEIVRYRPLDREKTGF